MPRLFSSFRRSPSRSLHTAYFEGVLGTSLEIQIVSERNSTGPEVEGAILGEIDRLELIFNAYNPASELRRWQSTHEEDISTSRELAEVLLEAKQWWQRTNGAFNPAVEALTHLWALHAQENTPVAPQEISEALTHMNGPLWTVNLEHRIARRHTTLPVTLNAIAKGFIIDAACQVAANTKDVLETLVNIGGDIRHHGTKPLAISIADPRGDAENAVPADRIHIHNQGLATSGDYRRGFQIGDKWHSHLLDPRTGYPVEYLVGVSVLAPDAMTADVLATAFSVLEPEQSLELADSLPGIGAFLIGADGKQHANSFWKNQRLK